jgi:hypothetical protein
MEIHLRFDDASSELTYVVPVGPSQFRLESTPLLASGKAYAGDTIEAVIGADGSYTYVRTSSRVAHRHLSWVVPSSFIGSNDFRAFVKAVELAGGSVERILGGVLFAHVPEAAAFDPQAELDRYLSSDWPEA